MKYFSQLLILLLLGCGSTGTEQSQTAQNNQFSGFLSDYSLLKPVDVHDDSQLQRFISKQVKARGYSKVLLDPISYYPAPPATDTISKKVLTEISQYFNRRFRQAIAKNIQVVNEPGEKTLRMKMAITGVKVTDKSLAAYQYIPIAFLVTAASGGMSDVEVQLQVEAEVVDSLSGELMAAAVKSGKGATLDNDKTPLTLNKVKPLIDSWAKTMQKTMSDNL
ncbi:DUF3313 domain-containing protein [Thalassomonas sp. RHCl1]|uniref:DUF3313 domain-containing protein n=1 Tax=Thalassomonas sp. RHCl1 TaxID=2995320 RepID=UPI00248C22C3|nr:DUF3313 domain-containing protein [Thalassomonas sp. RHCl1]